DFTGHSGANAAETYQDFLRRILLQPEVLDASLSVGSPLGTSFGTHVASIGPNSILSNKEGGPYILAVTPPFFRTMGTKLLRGRTFTDRDISGSTRVVVLNEAMAGALWPSSDALGKCIVIGDTSPCAEVVGIVETARRSTVLEDPTMQFYVPLAQ